MWETYSLDKITAAIYFDTRREKKDNLLYPVKYRVTLERRQLYYSSGIDLTEEEWKRLPTAKDKQLRENRELLQNGFEGIKAHIKDLYLSGDGFTLEQLNARLGKGKRNSVISLFEHKEKQLRKEGKLATADWYMYAKRSFMSFAGHDMKFSEITPEWLRRYENFLRQPKELLNKRGRKVSKPGKSYTTISINMRALQVMINEGRRKGYLTNAQYPFGEGKYQIPQSEDRKMALTLQQIGEILKFPLTDEKYKMSRDIWYFAYLCQGINIIDLMHLKYSDIVNGEISWYRIKTLNRSKRKRKIYAVILPEMQQIIDKWGNSDKSEYIFPFLHKGINPEEKMRLVKKETTLINLRMSKIGEALGIGSISTYTARHSFATVSKRAGVNIAYISESLGHSNVEITENYLASFESEERFKNAQKLIP